MASTRDNSQDWATAKEYHQDLLWVWRNVQRQNQFTPAIVDQINLLLQQLDQQTKIHHVPENAQIRAFMHDIVSVLVIITSFNEENN